MPKYEQIVQFIEVYHEKSITKAASNLFVTQQSLSHNIKRLEEDLGQVLFSRTARGVRPTEAGEHLYSTFFPIVCSFENAMEQYTSKIEENSISFAVTPAVIRNLTPNTLMGFCKSHSIITIEMKAVQDEELEKYVLEDSSRFGIITAPENILRERFECIKLKSEPLSLLVNKDNPLSKLPFVDFSELKNEQFLSIKGCYYYLVAINRVAKNHGFSVIPYFESDDFSNLMHMVEYGTGVMLCRDALFKELQPQNCTLVPISKHSLDVCTAFVFQDFTALSDSSKDYIRFLLEEFPSKKT